MPVDPAPGDWPALDAARVELGLTLDALWVAYVSIGGNGTPTEMGQWLRGERTLDGRNREFLAQAIHDEALRLRLPPL